MTIQPPKVVIVGRVNVGKSTLFNRLIEKQKSLVSKIPGTTRDRFEADCLWRGKIIRLVDTGGFDVDKNIKIDEEAVDQARLAIKEADAIIFVVDLTTGLQQEDRKIAKELMASKKPIILVGNKADTVRIRALSEEKEWHKWSIGTPLPISAARGSGTGDLLDKVFDALEEAGNPPVEIQDMTAIRVAVLGRPNVGKSSLLNSVVGHHRFITSDTAHTTREPNDTMIHVDGKSYLFIDTAGMRKTARMKAGESELETAGVHRSLQAIKRAHVAIFVIDISKSIQSQDKHLA
ncbi:MAG: ribosome biogenesis GTPase Der, partial [Patescibacteria group bacterium]